MLQVIKIHHVPVPLFLSIPAVKFFHQVQKGQKSPAAFLYRPGHLLRRLGGVKIPAFGRRLLSPVPAGGHEGLLLRVHLLAADGCQPVKGDGRKAFVNLAVIPCRSRLLYLAEIPAVILNHGLVGQGSVFLPADLKGLLHLLCQFLHLKPQVVEKEAKPGSALHLLQIFL